MPDKLEPAPPDSVDVVAKPPRRSRRWGRYLLYLLALLGVLLIAIVVTGIVEQKKGPALVAINEAETVDQTMTRAYGKYSPEKKGYLYVGDGNRPFLVRVIQQAKIEAVGASDELYFAASGAPLDGGAGFLYGVFQIRADPASKDGSLVEISSPYRIEGEVAVTPENVHFEALAEHVWAWVLKIQDGTDPKQDTVKVRNVMLAPHGDEIALLASFPAASDFDAGDCAAANASHAQWEADIARYRKLGDKATDEEQRDLEGLVETETPGCERRRWTYRTAPVTGAVPGALTVTSSGTLYGDAVVPRTWKLVFDSKAFSYIVPAELEAN